MVYPHWYCQIYTKICQQKQDTGLEIFTNTDFPAYSATKDKVFYAVVHIAEGISEFFVQAAQEEFANVDELKQVILRKAAMLKTELMD